MQAYDEMVDSGIDWLGAVPSSWRIKPLFSFVKEKNDKNSDNSVTRVLSLSYGNIIQRKMDNGGLLPESFATYQIVEPDDIILRLTDLQNDKRSLRVGRCTQKGIITSAYVCIRPIAIDSRYLYYLLHGYDLLKVFYNLGGGLRQGMKFDDLKRLPAFDIDEATQQKIAGFLDAETAKIDDLIAKQERLLQLFEEKRRVTIAHAVTRGLDPQAVFTESHIPSLGKIPAQWHIDKLKYAFEFIGGGTPSKDNASYWTGDIPWVSPKDMKQSSISDTEDHISQQALHESSTKMVPQGSLLLVVRSGILQRTIPVAINSVDVSLNQDMKALISKGEVSPRYFAYFITCYDKLLLHEWAKQGATVESLEYELMANSKILIPPMTEQTMIVKYLDREESKFNAIRDGIQYQTALLKERRISLISHAVTGKIEV